MVQEQQKTMTPKLREVWRLIALGLPTKAIAERLEKSEATIKVQIRWLLRMKGCSNRAQLALEWHGLKWEDR